MLVEAAGHVRQAEGDGGARGSRPDGGRGLGRGRGHDSSYRKRQHGDGMAASRRSCTGKSAQYTRKRGPRGSERVSAAGSAETGSRWRMLESAAVSFDASPNLAWLKVLDGRFRPR